MIKARQADIATPLRALEADGGPSFNAFLMNLQADVVQSPVLQSPLQEAGALDDAAEAFVHFGIRLPPDEGLRRSALQAMPEGSGAVWRDAPAKSRLRIREA